MRRVVITGIGIVSSIGNDLAAVEQSLRSGTSGIRWLPEYAALGLRSQVAGIPDLSREAPVARKLRRFMGDAAHYAYLAMRQAVDMSALAASQIAHPRCGLVIGSGVGSPSEHLDAVDILRTKGIAKVPPYIVPRVMGSTVSASLSTAFGVQGVSYSLTSACATGAHCIGHAAELIRFGKQDIVFAGGAEEVRWTSSVMFDAMGALSSAYNDSSASRPFDAARDGFVIAGGAGVLTLESLEHALARRATILGEVVGYGASCDGDDMVNPHPEGAERAMRLALQDAGPDTSIDYINAHATSTPVGDLVELEAIRRVFGDDIPPLSSTKGISGHAIAAVAAQEAVFSLLMIDRGFAPGCANIVRLDPAAAAFPILTQTLTARIDTVMSNSLGFGGTNACLIFRRFSG